MKWISIATLLFCFIAVTGGAGVSDVRAAEPHWNQFRGPHGNGHTKATGLPVTFSEQQGVKWKTPIEGKAWSSPVVWGDRVWLTTAPPHGKQMYVLGVDIKTGRIVHNLLVFENAKPQFCHSNNSYATPTPVVEEGRLYVHFGIHGTACINTKTGEKIWERRDFKCNHHRGPAASPIIHGEHLIVQFDGFDVQYVVAMNKHNGKTVWKKDRAFDFKTTNGDRKKAYCTPTVITHQGVEQLISPCAVATEAFDPKSGKLLWTVRHGGMNASARPVYGNGIVFITNGMGRMIAVKPGKPGAGDISDSILWHASKGVPKKSSQILLGDLLFMVADNGVASCFEAKSGDVIWTERLGGGAYAASPLFAAADGHIYFFSEDGDVTVIEAGKKIKVVARNKLSDGFMASPAVAGSDLILRTKSHLYRVGK